MLVPGNNNWQAGRQQFGDKTGETGTDQRSWDENDFDLMENLLAAGRDEEYCIEAVCQPRMALLNYFSTSFILDDFQRKSAGVKREIAG